MDAAPSRPVRVLLADDEPLVRAGIRAVLRPHTDLAVAAEAADGREAVRLALEHRPDVCLLDIRMPGLDGLAAAEELRRAAPGTAVVILTTFDGDDQLERALATGAAGFLVKSGDPAELAAGIRAAAAGGACLSPGVARRVLDRIGAPGGVPARRAEARRRVARLTARERDVLALLAEGLTNGQIARRLGLVEGTVKEYVSRILTRLDAGNRVRAAILAHEAGLTGESETP